MKNLEILNKLRHPWLLSNKAIKVRRITIRIKNSKPIIQTKEDWAHRLCRRLISCIDKNLD